MQEPPASDSNAAHIKERHGEYFAFAQAVIWGAFPVITKLSYNSLSPLYTAAFATLLSLPVFIILIQRKRVWHELRTTVAWKGIMAAALFIGFLYYGFTFVGLSYTSAGNTSIVLLMEVFFSFAILRWWGAEHATRLQFMGATLMVLGALLVLFHGELHIQMGDVIILTGCIFPPLGNHYVKLARQSVSSETLMFGRSLVSGLLFLVAAMIAEVQPSSMAITQSLPLLLINGVLLFGVSKLLWMESIHRISVSKAVALGAISPAFTLALSYLVLIEIPTLWQIAGFIPMFFGVLLLTSRRLNLRDA